MTERDLDALCCFLSHVPVEDLHSLGDASLLWLPPLRGMTSRMSVDMIRRSVELVRAMDQRLRTVAGLYCWMIPRNTLRPWMLYKLGNSTYSADFTLHQRLSTAMAFPGCDNVLMRASRAGALYACIMTNEPFSGALDHQVLCLCVWRRLPYLAVHVSGDRILRQFKAALGTLILTDSEALLDGYHFELESAFAVICRNIGGPSRPGTGETQGLKGFSFVASQGNGQPTCNYQSTASVSDTYQLAANEVGRHFGQCAASHHGALIPPRVPAAACTVPQYGHKSEQAPSQAYPSEGATEGEEEDVYQNDSGTPTKKRKRS